MVLPQLPSRDTVPLSLAQICQRIMQTNYCIVCKYNFTDFKKARHFKFKKYKPTL
jgi:hypothetical protein